MCRLFRLSYVLNYMHKKLTIIKIHEVFQTLQLEILLKPFFKKKAQAFLGWTNTYGVDSSFKQNIGFFFFVSFFRCT